MVSQEGEEGTCACHQESLQTVNEQPSSDCAATGNDLAASVCLVAFGLCREHKTLRQNSSWGGKRAGKAAGKDLLCKKHTGNAETISLLLSLTRLSTPTRHLAVGSSLPLEPQESSIDQTVISAQPCSLQRHSCFPAVQCFGRSAQIFPLMLKL